MSSIVFELFQYLCCCRGFSDTTIRVNDRRYKIQRLLGEGGMSFVYLVQLLKGSLSMENSVATAELYALKKIICPSVENISNGMREIENYKRFQSPYVIQSIDSQVMQEKDGSKTIYIILPYYSLGSLQDSINRRLLEGTFISEAECVRIMLGVTRGLLCLHDPASRQDNVTTRTTVDTISMTYSDETAMLLEDTPLEMDMLSSSSAGLIAYAHRDITPSNILFSSDGLPVIGDLGSCSQADITIGNRNQLSELQEWVNDNCTLPYTAPELLNLKLNQALSCKVDIWSMGCTFYTLMFGISPFEREEQIHGASLTYAINTGKYSFPRNSRFSERLLDVIKRCIQVDPIQRPTTSQLLNLLQDLDS
ncbi:hypothetical protein SKDZ_16G0410 [Saccharomyces kudriavzevii ZP591]|uniref:non-specific serine/threonine protein kinase n=1 Tax=Saccharomyces cerevisiae x Saccharomyces kudriavzevii (strain VIN7) TaxID=1095631 RepID=H0H1S1_SACCK|nr:YPL236C-like protein [Saccharomyces cerevisiae x Saccharomyces kudriavzevii VIN7]CAI4052746.1 hypothetical protein SKDZ_16G0410 [Saccharomyces kudriavzevii ZP591]